MKISVCDSTAAPLAGLMVLTLLLAVTPLEAATPALASHRAVYDLQIDRSSSAAGPSDMDGRLVLETTGTPCEGYSISTRFVTRISGGKRSMINDMRSTTWEAGDGSAYRFMTKTYVNRALADETDGTANRGEAETTVDLRAPEETEFSLGSGVLFPTQHILRILEAAVAGEKIVTADVFDGSDTGRKIFATTTVIGPRLEPGEVEGAVGEDVLGALPSWIVTVGYFDNEAQDMETPAYEFSYDLFSNGVSRTISLDYGDVVLVGDLTSIEFLETAPCDQ